MKNKRKTPLFSAIVLRVLEARFKEILRVKLTTQTAFELVLRSRTETGKFIADFDRYMVHLVSEFGEEELKYTFRILQRTRLVAELSFNELNKLNELSVNLYPNQQHGS